MFRSLIFPVLIIVIALIFFRPWGYLTLLLIPISAFWAYLCYKDAGWSVHGQQLTLTFRGLVKNTIFMKKSKIQSLTMWSSLFQDKKSLASIEASIISGLGGSGGTVEDLENRDIIRIYNWYKRG